jgi:hypothetical protein
METSKISVITYFLRRIAVMSAIGIFTICSAFSQKNDPKPANDSATVTFIRSEDRQAFYSVKFNNPAGEKFDVLVTDADGFKLYQSSWSDKNFSRVFRVPMDNGKVIIQIIGAKNKVEHKFELATESRVVDDVYVTKM